MREFDRLGRYGEAEPLYLEALAMQRRVLGNQHPGLAATLNNLAVLHLHQDHYAEAADFSRQALAILGRAGQELRNIRSRSSRKRISASRCASSAT